MATIKVEYKGFKFEIVPANKRFQVFTLVDQGETVLMFDHEFLTPGNALEFTVAYVNELPMNFEVEPFNMASYYAVQRSIDSLTRQTKTGA